MDLPLLPLRLQFAPVQISSANHLKETNNRACTGEAGEGGPGGRAAAVEGGVPGCASMHGPLTAVLTNHYEADCYIRTCYEVCGPPAI